MQKHPSHSQKPYTVIIGGANMDICGAASGKIKLNDSNPGTMTTCPGGVARNIAENLARLNVNCHLLTAVGADIYGDQIICQAKEVGINVDKVMQLNKHSTSTYLSVLDHTGDMMVAVNDMAIIDQIELKPHTEFIKNAGMIVADTNLNDRALAALAGMINNQLLIVDTVSTAKAPRIIPYLTKVSVVKANLNEAIAICGDNKDLPEMADFFHGKGVKLVFITLGPEGVFYSDAQVQKTMSVKAASVVNVNGAGDAFTAGLAYGLLNNMVLKDMVEFALSAARLAIEHPLTNNPEMSVDKVNMIKENEYAG